jgi:hypothetical protein
VHGNVQVKKAVERHGGIQLRLAHVQSAVDLASDQDTYLPRSEAQPGLVSLVWNRHSINEPILLPGCQRAVLVHAQLVNGLHIANALAILVSMGTSADLRCHSRKAIT